MSVFYRLNQDKSKNTERTGKWYARAVTTSVVSTRQLAEIMQRNCTVKRSDILAVIEELVETMRDQLQDSKRVKIDGFGSFKIGVCSKGAATANDFSVSGNIKGMRVIFSPERTSDPSGNRIKQFLQGVRVEELPQKKEKKSTSPTPNPSQSLTPNPSPAGEGDQGGGSNPSPAPSTGGDNGDQPDMD